MSSSRKTMNCLLALALGVSALPALAAQTDSKAKSCLNLSRIDSSEVKDDQTIIFRERGGQYYRNRLPYKCSGLAFEKAFLYRTSQSQLCDLDIIYVLQRYGGSFQQGAGCGLGKFEPIDKPVKAKAAK